MRTATACLLAGASLVGCVDPASTPAGETRAQADELVKMCVSQTGAPGAYSWKMPGERIDRLTVLQLPKFGGTADGAEMVNACIRQNAVLFQDAPVQVATPEPVPSTPAVTPAATPPVELQPSLPATLPATTPVVPVGRAGCPADVTGLYRGNLVC